VRIHIVALCLDDRPDRQVLVERELRRAGLSFTAAVATRPSDPGGYASVGIRGCNESHLRALRSALELDVDAVVVCEDDLMILRRFRRAWPRIVETLEHTDWQFLHLGYKGRFLPSNDAAVERVSGDLGRLLAHELLTLHFYAVHRSVLGDLVDYLEHRIGEPPYAPPDGLVNDFRAERSLLPLVAIPNLGVQRPSPSNLWPTERALVRALHEQPRLRPARSAWTALKRGGYELQSRWLARTVHWSPEAS